MLVPGCKFLRDIQKAFNLEGQSVTRLVIDIPMNGVVKVYVEGHASITSTKDVIAALEQLRPEDVEGVSDEPQIFNINRE